jgi:hypothetical protein
MRTTQFISENFSQYPGCVVLTSIMSLLRMSALRVHVIQLLVADNSDCVARDMTLVVNMYPCFIGT